MEEEREEIVAHIVWQDWAHHVEASPIENIGGWQVFNPEEISENWPYNGKQLVLKMTKEQLTLLRDQAKNVTAPAITPQPIPNIPPPAPIAPEE